MFTFEQLPLKRFFLRHFEKIFEKILSLFCVYKNLNVKKLQTIVKLKGGAEITLLVTFPIAGHKAMV